MLKGIQVTKQLTINIVILSKIYKCILKLSIYILNNTGDKVLPVLHHDRSEMKKISYMCIVYILS